MATRDEMRQFLKRKHLDSVILLTVIFAICSVVLWALPMPAINVYYKVAVDSAEIETKVKFHFDTEDMYEGSSTQASFIENGVASIRLDPLNTQAKSLKITIGGSRAQVNEFTADAQLSEDKWSEAASLSPQQLKVEHNEKNNTTTCVIPEAQLSEINHATRVHSLVKPFAQILLIALYLIVVLRTSVFRSAKAPFFYGGTLAALMIIALLVNVWVVKPTVAALHATKLSDGWNYASVLSYSETTPLTSDGSFSVQQKITLDTNEISSVRLPVTITGNVSPTDSGNPQYSDVYKSSEEFVDRYVLSISESGDSKPIYDGVVTPKLLNDGLGEIVIPSNLKDCKGRVLTVEIRKVNKQAATGLTFEAGTPNKTLSPLDMESDDSLQNKAVGNNESGSASSADDVNPYADKSLAVTFLYKAFPYKATITFIVISAVALIVLNLVITRRHNRRLSSGMCIANYAVLGAYVCGQSSFYRDYIGGFPDERAHISYVAYLATNKGVIPDFSRMRVYAMPNDYVTDLSQPGQFNYLGHPPFYYQFLRIISRPEVNGNVVMLHTHLMRYTSFMLGFAGILIAFYIGFTRLQKNPLLQLLYGLIVISAPNMVYVMSGVSNDALTVLTVAVFVLGIVRFYEERYNFLTYLIIALGICGSVMAKLTAGMIVCFIAIGVVLFVLLKEHRFKAIANWHFAASLPLYLVPALYYVKIYSRFGTVQPNFKKLAEQEYVLSGFYRNIQVRDQMGVWEYVCYYFQRFMGTWNTLAGHVSVPRADSTFTSHMGLSSIALTAILLIPMLVFVANKSRSVSFMRVSLGGVLGVFIYQMFASGFMGFNINGYPGGFGSRYYLCAMPILALIAVYLITQWFSRAHDESVNSLDEKEKGMTSAGYACSMAFAMLLVVDGFVYSVLMNLSQSAVFA